MKPNKLATVFIPVDDEDLVALMHQEAAQGGIVLTDAIKIDILTPEAYNRVCDILESLKALEA